MTIHDPNEPGTPDDQAPPPDGAPSLVDDRHVPDALDLAAGDATDAETALLEEITAAEQAAQRSVVHMPPGEIPEALLYALELRIEANLAQHVAGQPVTRVGSSDPDVRALEAPYSRRRAPEHAQDPTPHRTQEGSR